MHSHFLIIPLPFKVRARLASFCYGLPQVRWIEEENLHLILRSFGPLPDNAASSIHECLSTLFFTSFSLVLRGMDHFYSKGNRGIIWIGLTDNPQLNALRKEINRHLRNLPFLPEERSFMPHVILGYYDRLNPQRLGDYLMAHADYQSEPIEVTSCVLIRAIQTPKRTIYEVMEEYFASSLATGED